MRFTAKKLLSLGSLRPGAWSVEAMEALIEFSKGSGIFWLIPKQKRVKVKLILVLF